MAMLLDLPGLTAIQPTPEPTPAQTRLIAWVTGLIRRESARVDLPATIDPRDIEEQGVRTTLGAPLVSTDQTLFEHARDLWGLSKHSPWRVVAECTELAEVNPVFAAIVSKLSRSVAAPSTEIAVTDPGRSDIETIEALFADFQRRIGWEARKQEWTESALNEGGLTLETIVSDSRIVVDLEYRPHHMVFPQKENGRFKDFAEAWIQYDQRHKPIATFAAWQIADANLRESRYHSRGIPHLKTARDFVAKASAMVRGLYQKYVREGGSIEHYNMPEADSHAEMENFKNENRENLQADPTTLIRQFFSTGEMKIERLIADSKVSNDGLAIDVLLELVFMAAGVSKEVMGYKGELTIRDMTSVARENFFQTLRQIEGMLFAVLRQAFDLELLLQGIDTSVVEYDLIGGDFKVEIKPEISAQAAAAGAVTLNDYRRAAALEPFDHPLFSVPGIVIDRRVATALAVELGAVTEGDELAELLRGPALPEPGAFGGDGDGGDGDEEDDSEDGVTDAVQTSAKLRAVGGE